MPNRPRRTRGAPDRNVLGGALERCCAGFGATSPSDGWCRGERPERDPHCVCVVLTPEFLAYQRSVGNDMSTSAPDLAFPGLGPGDRWCIAALDWVHAYDDGVAPPVILAATHEWALDVVSLETLQSFSVDVPDDPSSLIT